MKVLIIGGGASGMAAALTASEQPENEVILLERQARLGRKLLATGNGRCNLTNQNASPSHYHGEQPDFCRYALAQFGAEETLAWFHTLGLLTVTEPSGRVYPYSDSANSVLDVLRLTIEQRENVTVRTAFEITSLTKKKGQFFAASETEKVVGDCAIVCAGGCAGGKLGGTELGYRLLASFGHSRTKLRPSLVQLRTDTTFVRSLKGVRCQALLRAEGCRAQGEVQFTDYGISGPVVFELSRQISPQTVTLDLLPQCSEDEVLALLTQRVSALPALAAEELLVGILHNRLGRTLLRYCGCRADLPCGELSQSELRGIAKAAKGFALSVNGTMGMEQAQVTAGGMLTAEFDPRTMESRLCRGLYAAGEVLDIDGDCGGYNLQWAWSSGRLAGGLRGIK